ncbi:2-polyprenyl-6-methoxyphenol hydroxylase-like FAD-dependent oxidoreductase [Microbacterium sp. SORGH_AS428]|uniref:FAD-dependent oxidoreductase n=1 Tax=Microbacterium sp. SORGH_AS_0428 TaxID=3041788 RepID=UPI00286408D8|nr:NAD(P)/FAD-dependent oxidoreductase [Microbacterium sp. SORGH_AS_0428]MDR6199729.1 2-polyprenyl-6-methoxyphenol hydroxylase-like FAD-dependent oxidoreductase [Microbacterium sp. SORGH_AS_0428]
MPEVIVVGAGPVGLLLTAELRRLGADVTTLEKRPGPGGGTRAIGIHPPTLAALEASGATERLLEDAVRVERGEARTDGRLVGAVDFRRLSVRFPFVATLPQRLTEGVLADLAGPIERGVTVTAVQSEGDRMRVRTAEGRDLTARVVIVAGGWGGRALAYRPAALRAHEYRDRYLMTDTAVGVSDPVAVIRLDAAGVMESFPLPGSARRFVLHDAEGGPDEPDARYERMRRALRERGEEEAADRMEVVTAFRVRRLVAPRLRRGGLVVVGDAAHEVSPIGGQGMNLGLLDAATLAPLVAEGIRTGSLASPALDRWERRRVRSARIAAAMASVNTALGRPAGATTHRIRGAALGMLLRGPAGAVLTRAYAMGFDADAR